MDVTADAGRQASRARALVWARLGLALCAVAILRAPTFRWTVVSDDEAIYDAMARSVNAGGVMYRDAVDHKPPGLVYSYAAAERIAGPLAPADQRMAWVHLMGLFAALLTALGLFFASRRTLGDDAWIPPLLYGVASAALCAYDGLAVNGELMMNAPTALAVWALVEAVHRRGLRRAVLDVAAGALVGVAGLYKWQALVVGLAFPFFTSPRASDGTFLGRVMRRGPLWLLGLFLPLAACAGYFHARHVLPEAWQWGGLFNLHYISDGPGLAWGLKRLGLALLSTVLPAGVLFGAGLWGLTRALRHRKGEAWGAAVWAVLALLCVAIGGRFFGHYFLQPELPLALLAARPLGRMLQRAPKATWAALGVPALAFFVFSSSPALTRRLFDPGQPDWAEVGRRLAIRAHPSDTLFIWGNVPPLYPLSDLPLGTRFSFCNYLTGLSPGTPTEYLGAQPTDAREEAWPLLLADLETRRPTWLLDTASAGWKGYGPFPLSRYPAFAAYVAAHYREAGTVAGARLYRRADGLTPRPASPPSAPRTPAASAKAGGAAGWRTPLRG